MRTKAMNPNRTVGFRDVLGRRDFGLTNVRLNDRWVVTNRLEEHYFKILLIASGSNQLSSRSRRIGGIEDSNVTPRNEPLNHIVEGGDGHVKALLFAFLITRIEEIVRLLSSKTLSTILAHVEHARVDPEPIQVARDLSCEMRLTSCRKSHHHDDEFTIHGAHITKH